MRNATCQITPLAYTKRRYKTLVGLVGNHLDGHCPCDDPLHGWERVRIYRCPMHLYQPFPERNATSSIMTVRFYFQQKKNYFGAGLLGGVSRILKAKRGTYGREIPDIFCFSDVSLEITQSEEEEEEKGGERSFFPAETVPPTRAVSYQEKNKEGSVKV